MLNNGQDGKARYITLDNSLLPWRGHEDADETSECYSIDELVTLLILLTNCNYCGDCLFSAKAALIKYLGRHPTRKECYGFIASVKALSNRACEKDRAAVFANGDMNALKPGDPLNVVVTYDYSKRSKKGDHYLMLYYDEVDKVCEASKQHSKDFSTMLCLLIVLKSYMRGIEYFDRDEGKKKKGYTTFISRETISKAVGISDRTVDAYVKIMAETGIIGFKSGRAGYTSNTYTTPNNRWLIEDAEQQNTGIIKGLSGYTSRKEEIVKTWYGGSC